jgi:hypothetical protein
MERQAILERLGWIFSRVRASEFLRDPDRAMQIVYDKLHTLGITPDPAVSRTSIGLDTLQPHAPSDAGPDGLVERVIRRAGELQQEWASLQPSRGKARA